MTLHCARNNNQPQHRCTGCSMCVCVSGITGGFNYVYVVDKKVIQTSLQFMLLNPGRPL